MIRAEIKIAFLHRVKHGYAVGFLCHMGCWNNASAGMPLWNSSLQPGDEPDTEADVSELAAALDYRPQVSVEAGIKRFVDWYKAYYRIGA